MAGELDLAEEETGAWPAFVDLLSASLLMMIIVTTIFVSRVRSESEGLRTHRAVIEKELRATAAFKRDSLFELVPDSQFVLIRMREEATFPQRVFLWDSLRPGGRDALRQIGLVLRLRAIAPLYREIRVMGHSDQDPYLSSGFSNWELSAARAAVVARFLINEVGVDPCRISASGVGPYYPDLRRTSVRARRTNLSSEAKRLNRRIEIQIVPRLATSGERQDGCYLAGDGTRPGAQ